MKSIAKEIVSQLLVNFSLYREPDPEGKLPAESLDAISLKQCFQRKGFT